MTPLHISIYPFFLKVFSHLGYYRMLSRAPCALHWSLLSISYIVMCILSFPGGSAGKESACNAGDLASIPGLGKSPGEGKGYPRRYSGLENSMD